MAGIYGPSSPADDFTVDSFGVRGPTGPCPLGTLAAWAAGATYVAGPPASFVTYGGASYACAADHTAGVFATDLAAGLWIMVAAPAAPAPPAASIIFALIFG